MSAKKITRLPAVKTLLEILPKGTEGGKEFARIIDLLLFHDNKKLGKKSTIFNDASGDYNGLDSLNKSNLRKNETTGYQYKFFPSPFSDSHRKEIEDSLKKADKGSEELKLKKWILITPENLIESSQRKNGGDVTWFENLKERLDLDFECEHWGHTQLISLFLQTKHLCLYYYPELIPTGHITQKTIQEVRVDYDLNFSSLYKTIEFVGMSVYKAEATRGVPMEDIYIPLSVTRAGISDLVINPPRTNPISLLNPGSKYVILGDPGSGKSTLLRFLSLVGTSRALQSRYNASADTRLPILVVLRRYADELKERRNLPLLEYIKETTQADFSLRGADIDFFEYFLESGRCIICFDGLDELPSPQYKELVRDRIKSLLITFPGNTAIVTSRIIGYQEPFKFNEEEFHHFRLTKLQLPEIECFVNDWYKVRVENLREREVNIHDLIRILADPENNAIRELAENPLLLTIVALVHRIDAVLPDERVVLYQKCTETLLNTWHTWKFKHNEIKNRGKEERRNRRRMEAIAFWMHCQSGGMNRKQRAIVAYSELRDALASHIELIERPIDTNNESIDLADEFLDFVKKRAGLLIEVGDDQYSFIHLTFQEYLASSGIITQCEKDGATAIWQTICEKLDDPRWHEVIRLLIAGLKSEESQEYIIEKILHSGTNSSTSTATILLGGLLVDGITAAEVYSTQIAEKLLKSCLTSKRKQQTGPILKIIKTWSEKDRSNNPVIIDLLNGLIVATKAKETLKSNFFLHAILNEPSALLSISSYHLFTTKEIKLYTSLIQLKPCPYTHIKPLLKNIWAIQDNSITRAPFENMLGACGYALTSLVSKKISIARLFNEQITCITSGAGPFDDLHINWLSLCKINKPESIDELSKFLNFNISKNVSPKKKYSASFFESIRIIVRSNSRNELILNKARISDSAKRILKSRLRMVEGPELMFARAESPLSEKVSWEDISSQDEFNSFFSQCLSISAGMKSSALWDELIKTKIIPRIPSRFDFIETEKWLDLISKIKKSSQIISEEDIYQLCWLTMFDIWLRVHKYRPANNLNPLDDVVDFVKASNHDLFKLVSWLHEAAMGNIGSPEEFIRLLELENQLFSKLSK